MKNLDRYKLEQLVFAIFFSLNLFILCFAQTNAIPTSEGSFELTAPQQVQLFDANGWSIAQPNNGRRWWVGTLAGAQNGSQAAYIGANNNYNGSNVNGIFHFFRDIEIPAGATDVNLSFYIKQAIIDNNYDFLYVFTTSTSNTPITGVLPTTGYTERFMNTANQYNNWTTITPINLNSLAGTIVRLVFTFKSDGITPHANPALDSITLTYNLSSCSSTPTGGTASLTPTIGPPSSVFNANVTGSSGGAGLNYQWQVSGNLAGPWTDIPGATSASATLTAVPTPATTRYYRRKITCTYSGQTSYSSSASFTTNSPTYCTPTVDLPEFVYISNIKIFGFDEAPIINNSTYESNGYSNFTDTNSLIVQQAQGEAINVDGVVAGDVFGRGRWKAWVDWNGDGDFNDTGEVVYNVGGIVGGTVGFGFQIPANQPIGKYRMRIRVNNSIVYEGTTGYEGYGFDYSPCNNFNLGPFNYSTHQFGETEDYTIEVIENCAAKILDITPGTFCLTEDGSEIALTAQASQIVTEFRWYDAATGGNLVGTSLPDATGTSTEWTTPALFSTRTYYVTTFNGECESTFRTAIQAEVKPTPEINFTSGTNEICGEPSVIEVSATGGNEIFHLINEGFEDGSLGGFINQRISTNTNFTIVDWINRTSIYKPDAPNYLAWRPAVSAGFGLTKFAFVNTDTNQGYVERGFRSPTNLNSTGLESLTLKFRMFFRRFFPSGQFIDNEYATIEISKDNGGSWVELERFTENVGMAAKFEEKVYHLPEEYLDQTRLAIRFRIKSDPGGGGWLSTGFAVDDVELYGEKPLEPSFTWNSSNPIGVYEDAEGTIEYTGGPISTVYIKPEQTEIESYADWNVVATATLQNGCNAEGVINITNNTKLWDDASTDWASLNWKPSNSVPTANQCVLIRKPVNILGGIDGVAKSIKVESTGGLIIHENASLTVENEVINLAAAEAVVVKHNANLVQINPLVSNSGSIQVEKTFSFVNGPIPANDRKQYNYIISPTVGQNLKTIYPGNPTIIKHEELTNLYYNHSGAYIAGRGFSIKEPSKTAVPTPTIDAKFKGLPFNGDLNYPLTYSTTNPEVAHGFNLIGNPYPSNLDIEALFDANVTLMEPTFLFWDNRGNILYNQEGSNYNGDNFAKYNAVSGTGTGTGQPADGAPDETRIPNRYAKVGTAFLIRALPTANGQFIQFNNSFRSNNNSGPGFFGKGEGFGSDTVDEKDRFWLNLNTPSGLEFMNAVVYFEEGSDEFGVEDTETHGASNDIYSLTGNFELAIQGKAAFENSDVVPIGIRVFETGKHSISILKMEGVFSNGQKIYLRDKLKGKIHDLTQSPYEFKANAGQDNNRFEIIYKRNFISASFSYALKNEIEISKRNFELQVLSTLDEIVEIEIFSLTSRSLFKESNVGKRNISIPLSLFGKEIIIVNVLTEKGERASKKFIVNL